MQTDATRPPSPFLRVESLSKRFGPGWALVRASFSVERGTLALVTGANGSGKTTLIRCLSTALVPDYGRALLEGEDVVLQRDSARRRIAALTYPAGFYGGLSARENLKLAERVVGLPEGARLDEALDRFELGTRDRPIDEMSSGMRQRFALARLALLARDLILLDEPETHLDRAGLALLHELIAEWRSRGAAIVCATHAPDRFPEAGIEIRLADGRPDSRP